MCCFVLSSCGLDKFPGSFRGEMIPLAATLRDEQFNRALVALLAGGYLPDSPTVCVYVCVCVCPLCHMFSCVFNISFY